MTRKLVRLTIIAAAAASLSACLIVNVERPDNTHHPKPPLAAEGSI